MALITDTATVWSAPVTLGTDEIWQARKGGVFLTTSASPAPDDGLLLRPGEAVHFSAGVTVRYRSNRPAGTLVVREAV